MEKRKREWTSTRTPSPPALFYFLFSVFFLSLGGCAAPGEPTPPRAAVPLAVADLTARQSGDSVLLTFTLPKTTVEGLPLEGRPQIEIYRGFLSPRAKPGPSEPARVLVTTIPSAVVDSYLEEGRVRVADTLKPEELAQHAGEQAVYAVRTRASKRRTSADSNLVALRVYPAPEPIREVTATVTETAVVLSWTPPVRTTAGTPVAALAGYRVYRAEVEPGAEAAAAQDPSKAKLKAPATLLAETPTASYRGTQFEFGRTYLYTVHSVAQYQSDAVESADSTPVVVTPRDTFPPAAPKGLVVVVVPATPEAAAHLELSWSISPEPDVAGYNIYCSEAPGASGQRMNRELLPTPTFRDMSVVPGRRYTFTVTAVDRAGNESPPSAPVSAEIPELGR